MCDSIAQREYIPPSDVSVFNLILLCALSVTPAPEKCGLTCSHETLSKSNCVSAVGILSGMDLKLSKYSVVYPQPVHRPRRDTDRQPAVG